MHSDDRQKGLLDGRMGASVQGQIATSVKIDVVFLIDKSPSMEPCFEALKDHIASFASGLANTPHFATVDAHIGFLAQSSGSGNGDFAILYPTSDMRLFAKHVGDLETSGNELTLPALDRCLDFPWREKARRFIVLITDETVATGANVPFQRSKLDELVKKMIASGVRMFVLAPECDEFNQLMRAPGCHGIFIDGHDDFFKHDFAAVLRKAAETISRESRAALQAKPVEKDLYRISGKSRETILS